MSQQAAVGYQAAARAIAHEPETRLQQAQRRIAETFQLAAHEFTPAEQRALLEYAIERVAREARRAW